MDEIKFLSRYQKKDYKNLIKEKIGWRNYYNLINNYLETIYYINNNYYEVIKYLYQFKRVSKMEIKKRHVK